MQDWPERERYTAEDLLQIIRILRDRENGCPWDKVQTHASIRKNFLEETCEALEAIDADDKEACNVQFAEILAEQTTLKKQKEEILQTEKIDEYELEKIKNKFEANTLFGELNVMNKAMNLGFYEMLGDLPLINREVTIYRSQTAEQIADFSRRTFRPENRSTLIYRAKQ